MRIDVFTLVPHAFAWLTEQRPIAAVLGTELDLRLFNYRDTTPLRAGQVDDEPYGGGAGMVLRVDVVAAALDAAYGGRPPARVIALTPLGRLFPGLPRSVRVGLDWVFTIAGAVVIVFALKAWVVNPYRIPSSSMEPTLHCAKPAPGCEARYSDRVLANRFVYHFREPKRGEIIVFQTRPEG